MFRRRIHSVHKGAWLLLGLFTLFTVLSIYLRFVLPSYAYLYIFQPIGAVVIALFAWHLTKGMSDRLHRKNEKAMIVLAAICIWFVLYFLAGFVTTFVKNALFATPLTIFLNVLTYGTFVVAAEYTRQRLMLLAGRKNVVWFGILVSIVFAVQQISFYVMFVDKTPEQMLKYFVSDIVPILSSSFLLTYLAISAGLPSMMVYRLGVLAMTLLLPVLPKFDWYLIGISSLILAVSVYISIDRFQQGKRAEHRRHYVHTKRAFDAMYLIVLIALAAFMSGFLQYKPVAILSNSMQPSYSRGDIVVIQAVDDPMDIEVGDIIQYSTSDKVITHRVIDIESASDGSGNRVFITQGDNNTSADPPILASSVSGVVRATVPYVGYPTIWLRALAG